MHCSSISCTIVIIILYTGTELEIKLLQEILSSLKFTIILDKQTVLQAIKKLSYLPFTEPAVALTCSLHWTLYWYILRRQKPTSSLSQRQGYFNINLPPTYITVSEIVYPLRLSNKNSACMSHLSHACYIHVFTHLIFLHLISIVVFSLEYKLRRDSVDGIATGYGLGDRRVGVRVPVGSRILSFPRRPDRHSCVLSLLSNGYRGLFHRG
jgi:hypothetical protein